MTATRKGTRLVCKTICAHCEEKHTGRSRAGHKRFVSHARDAHNITFTRRRNRISLEQYVDALELYVAERRAMA